MEDVHDMKWMQNALNVSVKSFILVVFLEAVAIFVQA